MRNSNGAGIVAVALAMILAAGIGSTQAEQTIGGVPTGDTQFSQSNTVDTSGHVMDLTSSAYDLTHSILIVNDDGTDTIHVEFGATDVSEVTTSDFPLKPGETLTATRAQDGAWRYLGVKASANTPAYRVLAIY